MSFKGVLTYSRSRLNSLGFKEHKDAFNFENIGRTKLNSVYHVTLNPCTKSKEDHDNIEIDCPVTVRLFKKGFRDTSTSMDAAADIADTVVDDFILAANRLDNSNITNVVFDNMSVTPIAESNDNSFIIEINFTALTLKSTR